MKTNLPIQRLRLSLLLISLCFSGNLYANNLQISGINRTADNVSFNISWENSWSNAINHDAVWVFIKYRDRDCPEEQLEWMHATLNPNMASHVFGTGLQGNPVDGAPNNTGIMIRRGGSGSGSIPSTNVTLNTQGLLLSTQEYEIKVLGIEMAFIPGGAYALGDGASEYAYEEGGTGSPFIVNTNGSIMVGPGSGQLWSLTPGFAPANNIPTTYPTGFESFYLMKTEITQQQYVEFLKCLQLVQVGNRYAPGPNTSTYTIGGNWPEVTTGGANTRACALLDFSDLAAYLDWAALRPMTEMEYEKACRGTLGAVPGEFAWGSTTLVGVGSRLNSGTSTETVSNAGVQGVSNYGASSDGTLRVGFLAPAGATRESIGAGYYGNLEMSGNLYEIVVNTDATGLNFGGAYGNGYLSSLGFANVPGWPMNAAGTGFRGGAWGANQTLLSISSRTLSRTATARYMNSGGRGCR